MVRSPGCHTNGVSTNTEPATIRPAGEVREAREGGENGRKGGIVKLISSARAEAGEGGKRSQGKGAASLLFITI